MDNISRTTFACLLLLVFSIRGLRAAATHTYYRAAVLQHVPFGLGEHSYTDHEIIDNNVKVYELAAKTAAKDGVDILVYPEWALYPHGNETREGLATYVEDIPDPEYEITNPCNDEAGFSDRQVLRKLSCIAKDNGIFIVVNAIDQKECLIKDKCDEREINYCTTDEEGCPDDGRLFFNTNVVFDRKGDLVARYYKTHLYFETSMDEPKKTEPTYFETDFGKFTTLICFDLMFTEAMKSVEAPDVLNVAYPTYWYDHSPYIYFATLYQQSWAMFNKINLLASNVQFPNTGTLGSGIYSGDRGALISTHNPHGKIKLLVSNVPKNPRDATSEFPLDLKRFILEDGKAEESNERFESKLIDVCDMDVLPPPGDKFTDYRCAPTLLGLYSFQKLEGKEGHMELCSDKFCCSLTYKADSMDEDYYFGVTSTPLHLYDSFQFGREICFLSRCAGSDKKVCTHHVMKSKTVFEKVEIKGNFSTPYLFPYAVDSDILFTDKKSWSFDRKSKIEYKNTVEGSSLLFLGLHGRLYELDKPLVD